MLTLPLADDEAAELRELLGATTLDLSTSAIDDEDRPRVDRLHAILQRLEAAMRGGS